MKYLLIRSQLLFVSVILLITFGLTLALVMRYNRRWDLTQERVYSLADSTSKILASMEGGPLEVLAFYPKEDPARGNFELFLKECRQHHSQFHYDFYDPDRAPQFAKQWNVKEQYTVILRYQGRQERLVGPTEESFTNALFRLAHPRVMELCFVTGHGEASVMREDRNGYRSFRQTLEANHFKVHEIILLRDRVPEACQVVVAAGSHQDWDPAEFGVLKQAIQEGRGVLFLIDPMDPGSGKAFGQFTGEFGIILGEDVIVDKMSRMVGGDFLVPMVNQYVNQHPITSGFNQPTFFPVTRSVQPSTESKPEVEVIPLAMSGEGSWAERNLAALEKGDTVFEPESDVAGPVPVAVAYQRKTDTPQGGGGLETDKALSLKNEEGSAEGRLVVVGDSDFLTNAYVGLSGNEDFALRILRWLAKDDRFVSISLRYPEFKPLLLNPSQRAAVVGMTVVGMPLFFVVSGAARVWWRRKTA